MKKIYSYLLVVGFVTYSGAQQLDPEFGTDGIVVTENTSTIYNSALSENGKIVVLGTKNDIEIGHYHVILTRYNTDGTLDTGFGDEGKIFTAIDYSETPFALKILQNGKILIGLNSLPVTEEPQLPTANLMLYNTDGTIDTTFGDNGKLQFTPGNATSQKGFDLIECADGKIFFLKHESITETAILRINPAGIIDTTFGDAGKITMTGHFERILPLTDGNIILGGVGTYTEITKIHADGSVFTAFGDNGSASFDLATPLVSIIYEKVNKIKELPNGKILALNLTQSSQFGNSFIQVNADGTPDQNFGQNGVVSFNNTLPLFYCTDFITQADGKILVCGIKIYLGGDYDYHYIIARLLPNGAFDTSFGEEGFFDFNPSEGTDGSSDILMQPDGNLILCGAAQPNGVNNFCLARVIFDNLNLSGVQKSTNSIYPNPFNDSFTISDAQQTESISIYDITGKKILEQSVNISGKINADLQSGIYFYKINLKNGGTASGKLIKA
jgi:uncharacterized delta-60 repeat protein